jgi:hypothetical protein
MIELTRGAKFYTRHGQEVTIDRYEEDRSWPWRATNGQWYRQGGHHLTGGVDSSLDLIETAPRRLLKASEGAEYHEPAVRDPKEKDTNPKAAIGVRKVPFSVIPFDVVAEVGLAMLEGGAKYGRHNYRAAGARASVYFDGTMRHLTQWWEGEDIDPDTVDEDNPDSGVNHITKAIASLLVLRAAMLANKFEDDRPPVVMTSMDWVRLNSAAASLIDKHADKTPHHYTKKDTL